jgi:hypothetical protein
MECPSCRAKVTGTAPACPRCGALLGTFGAGTAGAGIVEGTAERGPVSAELPLPAEGEQDATGAGGSGESDTRLVVQMVGLPAMLWRQPAVRTVAQAGTGAIMLTLGVRLLRAWLARPKPAGRVATTALPYLADLLQAPGVPAEEPMRRERSGEVVETVIFMRRVVRRR